MSKKPLDDADLRKLSLLIRRALTQGQLKVFADGRPLSDVGVDMFQLAADATCVEIYATLPTEKPNG